MQAKIEIVKIWSDEDMVELRVIVCDARSSFSNEIYVGHRDLKDTVAGLDKFKDHVHGGIIDVRFGEFGPEYAAGAFHARMHFHEHGRIFMTIKMQSEYADFGRKNVASEATLYLVTLPSFLDDFIRALRAVSAGQRNDAELTAIE